MDANTREVCIKEAEVEHAALLKHMGERLLAETSFFHRLPEERASSVEEMAQMISALKAASNCILLTAWIGDEPVGEAVLAGGQLARISHTATIGLGVLQAYWGQGLGHALLSALEEKARDVGHTRLELTVLTENTRAISLYTRHGYRTEGRKTGSVQIAGVSKDEFIMAKQI